MRFRFVSVLLLAMLPWLVHAQEPEYLQQLVQKAHELKLAENQQWLDLLHFKPYPFWPGARSLADDPEFFNAPSGRVDAAAELDATLKAFFSDVQETDKRQNPQCRFVARYHWLHERLHFDPAQMKAQECKRYNTWRDTINPQEVTLVFPSSYLNSPASMYGHTLLRIDAKDQNERTRLLAYTIGYTASTSETNGLLFAYMGLTGGYPGIFQTMPYYLKVREYSALENRDIWEYRLNLNAQEIERMLRHIWELGPTYFEYYFLDENCAYHLLSLLEVARPGLTLTDEFRWWAIPSDTVRAVTESNSLVREVVYRPSNATIIMQRVRAMPVQQRGLAQALGSGKLDLNDASLKQLPLAQQAAVVELGMDYQTYLQAGQDETAESAALSRKLMLARSALDTPTATPPVETPAVRPDQGHKSLRVSAGVGNRDDVAYQEIAVRPAYHDQLDPAAGYIRGAQIQFFNFALRHYGEQAGMRVEELVPIDIFSLASRNEFFQSLSWKANVGWVRKRMANGNEPLISRLNAAAGYAWDVLSLDHPAAQAYVFMETSLEGDAHYARNYALGVGPSAGIIADVSERWRLYAAAGIQRFALGDEHTVSELKLLQRFNVGGQTTLRLELARKSEFDAYWNDVKLSVQQYF